MVEVPRIGYAYRVVARTQQSTVTGHGHAGDGDVFLWDELVGALVLAQIPDSDIPTAITRYQLSLVRMNYHIVDWSDVSDQVSRCSAMTVIALDAACSCIPDFHRAILGASHHPFALTMERHACNVASVPIECDDRIRIGGANVIELHVVVSGRGQVSFIG